MYVCLGEVLRAASESRVPIRMLIESGEARHPQLIARPGDAVQAALNALGSEQRVRTTGGPVAA